jgi:MFS family permease
MDDQQGKVERFGTRRLLHARLAASFLFFMNGAVFASWVSRIPLIQQELGLSHAVLGAALLCVAAGAVVTMPLVGILNGRFGSERLCMFWVVPFSAALPLLALCPDAFTLGAALFFFGCGHGALDVAMNAQGVVVERGYGKPVMSSMHAMFSFGGLLGAGFGMVMAWLGWHPLPHFTLVSVVLGGSALFGCRYLLQGQDRHENAEGGGFVLPPKALVPLGIVAVAVLLGEGAMADWTGVFLHKTQGATEAFAAAGFAAFSVAMTIGRFSGDWLVAKMGAVLLVRISGLLAASGMALAVATSLPWASLIGFALVGAGCSTVVPCVFSAAGRMPGVRTGVALASVTTMGYMGFLIGPPLIGFVAEGIGLRGALAFLIGTSLLVAVLAGTLRERH